MVQVDMGAADLADLAVALVLVGWRLLRRCIWRTSRGIDVIIVIFIILTSIANQIVVRIFRGWHNRTFHYTRNL